jgi:hypothetical protein
VRPIYYPHRYTIIAVAPLAAVLGSVLALFAPRALCAVAALVLLATQLAGHISLRSVSPNDPEASDRPTADFLLTHAAPGDAIVFTSLTRGAADYYFHRAGASDRWLERSFPASTASHLGWIDARLDEQTRSSLSREAANLAQEFRANVARGAKVWVYEGHHPQIDKILLDELNADFALTGRHVFRAPYHDAVLEYRDRSQIPVGAH